MSTTTMRSAVAVSREWEDQLMREATSRMKRGVRPMPKGYADFFRDLTRKEPRSKAFFRHVPRVADAMAENGASLADVLAPLNAEEARIVARHYSHRLPSLEECQQVESNAQAQLDSVQLRVAESFGRLGFVPKALALSLEEAAQVHATAIKTLAAVTLRECGR